MGDRFRVDRSNDPHAPIGAFLLDALPAEERRAFEIHVRFCSDCQDEIARLKPAVDMLPLLFAVSLPSEGSQVTIDDESSNEQDLPELAKVEEAAAPETAAEAFLMVETLVEDVVAEPVELPAAIESLESAKVEVLDFQPDTAEVVAEDMPAQLELLVDEAETIAVATAESEVSDLLEIKTLTENDLDVVEVASETEATDSDQEASLAVEAIGITPVVVDDVETLTPGSVDDGPSESAASKKRGRRAAPTLPKMALRRPVAAPTVAVATPKPPFPWTKWAVGALCLAAIATFIWGLLQAQKVDDLNEEIAFLSGRVTELDGELQKLQAQTPSVTYELVATSAGAPESSGTIFVSPNNASSVLTVSGMAALPSDSAYQVWYIKPAGEISPGPIFQIDEQGNAALQLASDTYTYAGIGITVEPRSGSPAPTTPVVLQGLIAT